MVKAVLAFFITKQLLGVSASSDVVVNTCWANKRLAAKAQIEKVDSHCKSGKPSTANGGGVGCCNVTNSPLHCWYSKLRLWHW